MSDYHRIKAVRYPITEAELVKATGIEGDDLSYELEQMFPHMTGWDMEKFPRFRFRYTYDNKYNSVTFLDYEFYDAEGDGDWGKVRELTDREKSRYEKIFKQILPEVDSKKLKLVEYCWYNSCEAPAYYDETEDPFYDEI